MTEPTTTAPGADKASGQATTALVLGILGIVCCGLLAPIAWYMGSKEMKAIAAGQASKAGEGLAKAGMILGIIGTVLLACAVLWIFFWGGLAVVQGVMGS